MQTVRWLAFCGASAISRSLLHFFPSSGGITAPYAANCILTLFSNGAFHGSVSLEGVRLSQPDGVRLEEAFPGLKEGNPAIGGLAVEISVTQQRIDLSGSDCIVEILTGGQSAKFRAQRRYSEVDPPPEIAPARRCFLTNDSLLVPSLVAVNHTGETVQGIRALLPSDGPETSISLCERGIGPASVAEISLPEEVWSRALVHEAGWGPVRGVSVEFPTAQNGVGYFVMYRDSNTKRPVSVSAV